MNLPLPVCAAAALFVLSSPNTPVSEPTGVFAIIDKVILKPDAEKPTEIELHGAFAVAAGGRGDCYRAARAGVLRFALGKGPEESVKQWREMQKHAGTGAILAFSSRYEQNARGAAPVRVVDASATPGPLPPYGCEFGLHRLDGANWGPLRELSLLPRCEEARVEEAERPAWLPRLVTLSCRNCTAADTDLTYVFEVQTSTGDRFASPTIPAGAGKTSWKTEIFLEPGETATWSVHVTGPKVERAPCDTATLAVPAAPPAGR